MGRGAVRPPSRRTPRSPISSICSCAEWVPLSRWPSCRWRVSLPPGNRNGRWRWWRDAPSEPPAGFSLGALSSRRAFSRRPHSVLGFGCGSLRQPPEYRELAREPRACVGLPKHRRVERACSHIRSVCRVAVALRSQPFRDRYQLSCSARPAGVPARPQSHRADGGRSPDSTDSTEAREQTRRVGRRSSVSTTGGRLDTGRPGQSVRHASRRAGRREAVRYRESHRNRAVSSDSGR